MLDCFDVATDRRFASENFLVISSGRSVVQASQQRKSTGLCKVQMGHVHPVAESDSSKATGAFGIDGSVLALLGATPDFDGESSDTKRLTGRSVCCGDLNAAALAGFDKDGAELEFVAALTGEAQSAPISPPPLPVGFAAVASM